MQAIELITNDDFLAQYNLTIDTSDVVDYMRKAIRVWTLEFQKRIKDFGGYDHEMQFANQFGVYLAEILTSRGFCFSFNVVDAQELFRLEE
jgi:hypothetical protein